MLTLPSEVGDQKLQGEKARISSNGMRFVMKNKLIEYLTIIYKSIVGHSSVVTVRSTSSSLLNSTNGITFRKQDTVKR